MRNRERPCCALAEGGLCDLNLELAMLRTDVISPPSYTDLGDAWVRYQSARVQQTHVQLGRHFRLDLNGLLHGLATAARARRRVPGPATLGDFSLRANPDDGMCEEWLAS